jgi:hypothetical protein
MPITMNDLTISPQGIDFPSLLNDWTWAMPEPLRPVLLTAMGDAFAQGESGAVYFLDAVAGEIEPVADDGAAFQELLRDNAFVTGHLYPSRIVHLRKAGMTLGPQQVYSHQRPLMLGGTEDDDNVEVTDVSVHLSLHGQIHEQIKDLPEGTPISDIKIEGLS